MGTLPPVELRDFQKRSYDSYVHLNPFVQKGQTVLAGSSLMEFFPFYELRQNFDVKGIVYNRGIAGFISRQLLQYVNELILDLEPSKLFINIGTNDIGRGYLDELFDNYHQILSLVKEKLPECRIYVMAFYPCNEVDDFGLSEELHTRFFTLRTAAKVREVNEQLKTFAENEGVRFIDVNEGLMDENGYLKKEYGIDGIHMWAGGYVHVLENMLPYLNE